MDYMKRAIPIVVLGLVLSGCSRQATDTGLSPGDNNFNSTLWMQNSAEFKASTRQIYHNAAGNLAGVLKDSSGSAALEQTGDSTTLPPAIVLDIDETVLNNSSYDARLILNPESYGSASWDEWVSLRQAGAVPGAVGFINAAGQAGVEAVYITNRKCQKRNGDADPCPQKADTIENLKSVGLKEVGVSNVLLRGEQEGWTAEKRSRREFVANNYRIIMLFGDDLGDFLPDVKKDITPEQRDRLVVDNEGKWGRVWYLLPNPRYGSWLSILQKPRTSYLKGY